MAEYGNPDVPEEWEYIKKYSPYQNLKKGTKYPEVFFTTSTRDDRVHPGHARKMVAKMEGMGNKVYYFENTEGGHAGSSTNEQRAKTTALQYSYLWMMLGN
jgi:prolyl oligopeptidase